MKGISHKIKYALGLVTLASVLFIALFGLTTMSMGMSHDKNMMSANMTHCPYMVGESSMCTMSLFDHVSAWQNSLTVIPFENMLFMLLLSLIFITFTFFNTKQIRLLYEKHIHTKIQLYEKMILNHPLSLFVSLFSQGILNTKSY